MYVKGSNFAIYLGLAAIMGFGMSFLTGGLGTESGLTSGDISKASRYTNQKEDPAFTVIEEKLRSDEEFFSNTKGAMSFLQNRMAVLSELSDETLAACEGISEFEPLMEELKSINARSFNTASAMENAGKCLDKIADGEKASEYEVYSNMAYIGFSKVSDNISFGQRFLRTAEAFLEGNKDEKYRKIADLASVWAIYCTQDAYLNSSEPFEMKFAQADTNKDGRGKPNINIPWPPKFKVAGTTGQALGNSALDEYLNSLTVASERVMAAGVPDQVKNSVADQFRNVAVEQINSAFEEHFVKNSVSEQVRNSVSEQVRNSVSEQVRNSVSEQVRNSAQDAMRAAFPGEIKLGSD